MNRIIQQTVCIAQVMSLAWDRMKNRIVLYSLCCTLDIKLYAYGQKDTASCRATATSVLLIMMSHSTHPHPIDDVSISFRA